MTDYPQRVSDSFYERKRLIRLRRKKENLRFWEEFRIIPRWLTALVAVLYVIALVIAITVNLAQAHNPNGNNMFPWELRDNPALASLAMAGIVTAVSLMMAVMIFMVAYVNRDASRRGMSAALWTILVIILLPAWGFIGFVIYFLMFQPQAHSSDLPNTARSNGSPWNSNGVILTHHMVGERIEKENRARSAVRSCK
ncbi:MAG: hypothetical protein DMG53_10290 [Acidobacteria bacterium]|nr:MAG: hypothetical protein DMG53_10290 [Acidobacteriota bacterium]